jgi:AmmeMemoRadiSam system protein A
VLTHEAQRRLLVIAREALEARVWRRPAPPTALAGGADILAAAFVSIHRRGALRGCLGRLEHDWPLPALVAHLAAALADQDPRFHPVTPEELVEIAIEISVLTPERAIASPADIEVGRHGLVVEHGSRRGLLLRQVATDHGWDRITFLEHTCVKAGLPRNAWQNGARVFVFESVVFGEDEAPA